jgi:quercetin dioxygenase-like cupin family protein
MDSQITIVLKQFGVALVIGTLITLPTASLGRADDRAEVSGRAPTPRAAVVHAPTTDSTAVPKQPTPTVFQADEGDRWMLLGDKSLIFKVDPVSTGSDALLVGTEEMPPGNIIPTHKHLYEDEVIFVHKGAVRVTLADREYDAGTGATVFIPHGTWIGVANVSSQPAMILFFFNKPAFGQCLRAMSSRPGESFTMPAPEKMAAVRAECHEVMKQ